MLISVLSLHIEVRLGCARSAGEGLHGETRSSCISKGEQEFAAHQRAGGRVCSEYPTAVSSTRPNHRSFQPQSSLIPLVLTVERDRKGSIAALPEASLLPSPQSAFDRSQLPFWTPHLFRLWAAEAISGLCSLRGCQQKSFRGC